MIKVTEIKGHLYAYDTGIKPTGNEWRRDAFTGDIIRESTGQYQYKVVGSTNPILELPLKPEHLV